ncbi:hypothetical protein [Bradyrhizobium sp. SZCCHNS2005]|uniref:hypothetical protein n=1 Tax=Bradyrhizobium sp. SZCCHNS2005 TaxID=3057303 RepID=UPI0028ED9910|nr:hypothetical protein [Bradyrhizobium sp. SZCCHNS2005]
MTKIWLADIRRWAVCLIAYCAACTSAVACVVPGTPASLIGILFEHVPPDIDAPVAIEATIYDETEVSYSGKRAITLMRARVDRVIKGSVNAKYINIFVYPNSCAHVGIGRGIVIGTLRDDPQRGIMLEAIRKADMRDWSKEFFARHVAITGAAKCEKNEFGVRECRLPGIGPESPQP